jgi:hypothetical protein
MQIIHRHYPCDCTTHIPKTTISITHYEENDARILDSLFAENALLEPANRTELLKLYYEISASFHTFNELEIPSRSLGAYDVHFRRLIRENTRLHSAIADLVLSSDEYKQFDTSIPRTRPVLHTDDIIQDQINKRAEWEQVLSRGALGAQDVRPSDIPAGPPIPQKISRLVLDKLPGADSRCVSARDLKLEKSLLASRVEKLEKVNLCDLPVLECEYRGIRSRVQNLAEEKNRLLTEISRLRSQRAALDENGILKSEASKLDQIHKTHFREILEKNARELRQVNAENREIQARIATKEAVQHLFGTRGS